MRSEAARASTILRAAVGSVRDQEFGNLTEKCRGGHVKSCVAGIEIVSDVGEEERSGLSTCSALV
jgi:hypothetical protein